MAFSVCHWLRQCPLKIAAYGSSHWRSQWHTNPKSALSLEVEETVESTAVIAFVAITSLINIGLGYALAIYLGQAKTKTEPNADEASTTLTLPTRKLTNHEPPAATSTAVPATPAAPAATVERPAEPPATPSVAEAIEAAMQRAAAPVAETDIEAAEQPPATADEAAAPVEHELLAGIEEFRSQLAQLKGTGADPAAAPQPAAANT